jgi:hypothetical protein
MPFALACETIGQRTAKNAKDAKNRCNLKCSALSQLFAVENKELFY